MVPKIYRDLSALEISIFRQIKNYKARISFDFLPTLLTAGPILNIVLRYLEYHKPLQLKFM